MRVYEIEVAHKTFNILGENFEDAFKQAKLLSEKKEYKADVYSPDDMRIRSINEKCTIDKEVRK
jgi:hypothetical protein